MLGVFLMLLGATIPDGWPMFRCNQERTGYTPGKSCFANVQLKWEFLAQNSEDDLFYASPVAADFTLDGQKDILYTPITPYYPMAEVHEGVGGELIWQSSLMIGGPYFATPALMDVSGDGIPEIFLNSHFHNQFYCLNGNGGSPVWINSSVGRSRYSAPLVIESPPTVIVGDDNGVLWSFDATNGTTKWSKSIGTYIQPPSYGEVDGDSAKEIVVVAGTNLYVYDFDGNQIWKFSLGDNATTPMLVNLDADASREIVVYCYTTGYVKAFNFGNTTPFINTNVGAFTADTSGCTDYVDSWAPSPAAGDMTLDGIPDIIIHNGATLFCVRGNDGGIEWQNTQTHLWGSPCVANLDESDTYLEIVVTGCPGISNGRAKIELYDHTGVEKWEWYRQFTSGFPDPIPSEACLVDLDNDGRLEITAVDFSCYVPCLDCIPSGVDETGLPFGEIRLVSSIVKDAAVLVVPRVDWLKYTLFDVSGRVIGRGEFGSVSGSISIPLPKMVSGAYFLQVTTPSDIHKFKLIKLL